MTWEPFAYRSRVAGPETEVALDYYSKRVPFPVGEESGRPGFFHCPDGGYTRYYTQSRLETTGNLTLGPARGGRRIYPVVGPIDFNAWNASVCRTPPLKLRVTPIVGDQTQPTASRMGVVFPERRPEFWEGACDVYLDRIGGRQPNPARSGLRRRPADGARRVAAGLRQAQTERTARLAEVLATGAVVLLTSTGDVDGGDVRAGNGHPHRVARPDGGRFDGRFGGPQGQSPREPDRRAGLDHLNPATLNDTGPGQKPAVLPAAVSELARLARGPGVEGDRNRGVAGRPVRNALPGSEAVLRASDPTGKGLPRGDAAGGHVAKASPSG